MSYEIPDFGGGLDKIPAEVLIEEIKSRHLADAVAQLPVVEYLVDQEDALTPLLQLILGQIVPFL